MRGGIIPRGSKYLLRRYSDPFLHPRSHPQEVLVPSGIGIYSRSIYFLYIYSHHTAFFDVRNCLDPIAIHLVLGTETHFGKGGNDIGHGRIHPAWFLPLQETSAMFSFAQGFGEPTLMGSPTEGPPDTAPSNRFFSEGGRSREPSQACFFLLRGSFCLSAGVLSDPHISKPFASS